MALNPDWKEFVELLNSTEVEYVVVGAFALAFHGHPRLTGDIDIFVRNSEDNSLRVLSVLEQFGFGSLGLTTADFHGKEGVVQLGYPPRRIDILTHIDAVTFDQAWKNRVAGPLNGTTVNYISAQDLKHNKLNTGRAKDIADAAELD